MKELAFPQKTRLAELFSAVHTGEPFPDKCQFPGKRKPGIVIQGWCSVRGKPPSLAVDCMPDVEAWIYQNMLQIDYDKIYFTITVRDNGTALVCAQYNQIIGDRWLALIDAADLDQFVAAE